MSPFKSKILQYEADPEIKDQKELVAIYLGRLFDLVKMGYSSIIKILEIKKYIKDETNAKSEFFYAIVGLDLIGLKSTLKKEQLERIRNLIYKIINEAAPRLGDYPIKEIEYYENVAQKFFEDDAHIPAEALALAVLKKWLGGYFNKFEEKFGIFGLLPMEGIITQYMGTWHNIIK